MELTPKQQTTQAINSATKILILTHINPDGDALGSLVALCMVLKKIGKEVTAVMPEATPNSLSFLPSLADLTKAFSGVKDFVITIDTSRTNVERLGYKHYPEENKLNIVVTPVAGTFSKDDITFSYGAFKFDLIIVLDSPDLERLGPLYDTQSPLFYETPVVNIDHHSGNDFFGKINWVDLTSTSTAEILVSLMESLAKETPLIDENIATALLTGIITDTGSFQNANTTPKSLTVAAQLVAAGGRQQEIIRNIFKTKPFTTLKLWGKILESVRLDEAGRFIWATVSKQDFAETGALPTETSGVIDELLKSAPDIDFVLLLTEKDGQLDGSLRSVAPGVDVSQIAKLFDGGGHEAAAGFQLSGASLAQDESEILTKIRAHQSNKA
jgi:phosphoesterase RecJ-like protein